MGTFMLLVINVRNGNVYAVNVNVRNVPIFVTLKKWEEKEHRACRFSELGSRSQSSNRDAAQTLKRL